MSTVVLSGYFGYENAGDEALLKAMIAALRRRRPNLEIIVLSGQPEATAKAYQVKAVYRYNPIAVLTSLLRADLVISGGGSLLQDVTGPLTVPYYLLVVAMAALLGRKAMFYAQGIGPVNGRLAQWMIRHVANRIDLITLRDAASRERLQEMGVTRPPVHITADPVFALPPWDGIEAGEPASPPEAIFCLRRWSAHDAMEKACMELARYLLERGWQVTFLPMHAQQDVPISQEMGRRLDHPRVRVLDHDLNFEHALQLIARSSLMVGVRLHALLFATLVSVPVLGIAYDPKVSGFLAELERPAFGDTHPLTGEGLIAEVRRIEQNMAEERRLAMNGARRLKAKAEQNAILAIDLMEGRRPE
ncbi:polysaccharide pyruvyl transferase CsaB [Heliophilum fasciatum]|uniref:Polysaccharide pyruvyl transferase CsaB n=1 Tax=Heliophilum fasciatum TaxID=35700 RepID=A0A4R2RMM5_9FIRM|nr:polysaccharide pyruvyl transferase CsaB [Heliophilum fasciatum]MCW2277459.1 polysaccharide pyruvyl transferase CsaB [Heliophilum fasciatum]TCP65250.1 polysaccharide pyruvyl transferase CsaB [Heliophilum fasciatum]